MTSLVFKDEVATAFSDSAAGGGGWQGADKCFPCISQQSLAKGATFAALPKSSTLEFA
jgi:hypothetical protein